MLYEELSKIVFILLSLAFFVFLNRRNRLRYHYIIILAIIFFTAFEVRFSLGQFIHFFKVNPFVNNILDPYLIPYISILDFVYIIPLIMFVKSMKRILSYRELAIIIGIIISSLLVELYFGFVAVFGALRIWVYVLSTIILIRMILQDIVLLLEKGDRNVANELRNFVRFLTVELFVILLLQSLIALFQIMFGHSLGLSFLGEPTITVAVLGSSTKILNHTVLLRGYGTFVHPNVLAGFSLLLSVIGYLGLYLVRKEDSYIVFVVNRVAWFKMIIMIAGVAILLSMSRIAILLFVIDFGIYCFFSCPKFRFYGLVVGLLLISILSLVFFFTTEISVSLSTRIGLLYISLVAIRRSFPFGLGVGMFTKIFDTVRFMQKGLYVIQPVHNMFLLILAELGVVGVVIDFFLLKFLGELLYWGTSRKAFVLLMIFCNIFIIGLLDHYYATQTAGLAMLSLYLVIAIVITTIYKSYNSFIQYVAHNQLRSIHKLSPA